MSDTLLLSLIAFLPSLAALVLLVVPSTNASAVKWISLAGMAVTFALTLVLLGDYLTHPQASISLVARAEEAKTKDDPHDLVFRYVWIGSDEEPRRGLCVEYYMGVDGISLPLVLLTGLISLLAMIASWNISQQIRGFCILSLLLETGMMGTFLALDFFLFFVFWEIMLLPMYFLIGVWGAPSRVEPDGRVRGGPYAAIKFFLYTMAGSVLMLIAMLAFYFQPVTTTVAAGVSGMPAVTAPPGTSPPGPGGAAPGKGAAPAGEDKKGGEEAPAKPKGKGASGKAAPKAEPSGPSPSQPGDARENKDNEDATQSEAKQGGEEPKREQADAKQGDAEAKQGGGPPGQGGGRRPPSPPAQSAEVTRRPLTFDIMQLHRWGMAKREVYTLPFQLVMFILLYIAFAIKVPVFPFHTWLPDAHVEAPTPISMILAGVLLKMGGYGLIRIAYPLCPQAAFWLAPFLVGIGVWNIIYGAFAAMAQTDFKKLVAYSSISHMGYVILGIAVWSNAPGFQAGIWSLGMNGAMFQMIAHGISSAGMFFLVGVIYDRVHHRDLNRFGGLATAMPLYGGVSAGIFFAALGLPGLCGFVGEVMTVLASWQYSRVMAVIAATGVILTAGYILWTLQRVFLGVSKTQAEHGHGHGHEHGHEHTSVLEDITFREMLCAVPLLVLAVALGVYPDLLLSWMQDSVTSLVRALSDAVS